LKNALIINVVLALVQLISGFRHSMADASRLACSNVFAKPGLPG